jgi:isoleucyl-tRNA synthetase
VKRRSYRTVLDILFHAMVRYAAPVLVFTAEEVWGTRYPDAGSVHLLEWPEIDAGWANSILAYEWNGLRVSRLRVSAEIEPLRREKIVGSSLEAMVKGPWPVGMPGSAERLEELFISSTYEWHDSADIIITKTNHHKCGRCWRHLPEVTTDGALCERCETVLASA